MHPLSCSRLLSIYAGDFYRIQAVSASQSQVQIQAWSIGCGMFGISCVFYVHLLLARHVPHVKDSKSVPHCATVGNTKFQEVCLFGEMVLG